MNFQENLKTELFTIQPQNKDEVMSEFIGLIRTGAVIKKHSHELLLHFSSRHPALIKKCVTHKKSLFPHSSHAISVQEKRGIPGGIFYCFDFSVTNIMLDQFGFQDVNILSNYLNQKLAAHFLRGVFESRGYISNPLRGYHLEIQFNSEKLAHYILKYLHNLQLDFRSRTVKGEINLYLKNSQLIADFIRFLGAHQSYLEIEKIMVEKSTINEITRWVNYETANLNKIVASSSRQRKKIQVLDFDDLPLHLQEIARLRLENPCSSLREIGGLCNPPLSKSEVHRRLNEIEKIADQKGFTENLT
ncbi:MAG TPA: DNA-binding protein WhiA [Candidatus Atribacteria bacterium]|nr:DNA-binding protein WhiA [Candidatus Atribacteria bacterium]HCU21917.1 DNA-binding protein WhiA [Candidatus Atribacteria bacterium]